MPQQAAVDALVSMMTSVVRVAPDQVWFKEAPGTFAMVTGVPFATLNGVWVIDDAADPSDVTDLFTSMPIGDMAYSMQVCPGSRRTMTPVAQAQGMLRGPDVPLMVLTDPPAPMTVDGLMIRELGREEFDARTDVAAAGYGVPASAIQQATSLASRAPGYRMYLGEVAGRPVTTAVGITDADAVGVFDVATPPQYRGNGYGAAITTHTVLQGFNAGARWAWLQSSTEGLGVYERIGFRTVQEWGLWVSPEAH